MSHDDDRQQIEALSRQVSSLTRRVYLLEESVTQLGGTVPRPAAPTPPVPTPTPGPVRPATGHVVLPPAPAARRPRYTPPPPREPVNWSRLAEQAFAARTLAWAGGIATALGIVLLFVMASSRGWITLGMRVGLGVLVSLGLLAFSFELDRRKLRADAILAAGGAGIAGLYASLWASISAYHLVGKPLGLPLAAAIAALAVALAIRIRQQPLAIFGVVAAMLAPALVSQELTGTGALFGFVIACAGLPLYLRYRWELLAYSIWATAALTMAPLYVTVDPGATAAVLAGGCFFALFTTEAIVFELWPAPRRRISELGWLLLSSSITLGFATSFLYAGHRLVSGRHLSGYVLLGLAAVYVPLALAPRLLGRRQADLEDVLAGFALTALATATGLLLGGSGMVCAWAAESMLAVAVCERMLRRDGTRRLRLTLAGGAYLALAVAKTALITVPSPEHLNQVGAGSTDGVIALAAVTFAGIVYCYGVRFLAARELRQLWLVPALALGYLPVWALDAQWAVSALAVLAAAVYGYRRSPWMVRWFDDQMGMVIATGYWVAGLAVSAAVAAPLDVIFEGQFGGRDGLLGLALLVASGCVGVWSLRRPRLAFIEFAALAPATVFGYLLCEALSQHQAVWAALAVSAAAAVAVHLPALRRRIGEYPLLTIAGGYLAGALIGLNALDQADRAIAEHGTSAGWGTLAVAVGVSFLLATAVLDRTLRGYAMWLPALLTGWLATLLLDGQYPLVIWAAISVVASSIVIWRPPLLERRISRQPLRELAAASAVLTAGVVLAAYETPSMLFRSNHDPAGGLASALAGVVALGFVVASSAVPAGDGRQWRIGGYRVCTIATIATGAMALWTLAAAILGAFQLALADTAAQDIHDAFQQGHVMVSVSWVLIGLALVIASLRGHRRSLRIAGIALLFAALAKLFLYDLAFLTAMARAISFIVTGSILLVAALLLQRFTPQVRAALSDDTVDHVAPTP